MREATNAKPRLLGFGRQTVFVPLYCARLRYHQSISKAVAYLYRPSGPVRTSNQAKAVNTNTSTTLYMTLRYISFKNARFLPWSDRITWFGKKLVCYWSFQSSFVNCRVAAPIEDICRILGLLAWPCHHDLIMTRKLGIITS